VACQVSILGHSHIMHHNFNAVLTAGTIKARRYLREKQTSQYIYNGELLIPVNVLGPSDSDHTISEVTFGSALCCTNS
jgi:hypothetical protein